jgi:hypothetical protein
VEDIYHGMVQWGLIRSAACAAHLVDNRLPEAAATPAGDEPEEPHARAGSQPARETLVGEGLASSWKEKCGCFSSPLLYATTSD